MKNPENTKKQKSRFFVTKLMSLSWETVLGKGWYDKGYMTGKCLGDFGRHHEANWVNE